MAAPTREERPGSRSDPNGRAWLIAWLGGPFLGTVNGIVRERFLVQVMPEERAHQVSTLSLLVALFAYMSILGRRWPLSSSRAAARVGVTWSVLTIGFEFGLGRLRRIPWSELAAAYDVRKGRIWALVPVLMAVGPPLSGARQSRSADARRALSSA